MTPERQQRIEQYRQELRDLRAKYSHDPELYALKLNEYNANEIAGLRARLERVVDENNRNNTRVSVR